MKTAAQIVTAVAGGLLLAVALTAGSFSGSKESISDAERGHPAGWSSAFAHGAAAKSQSAGFSICTTCHGAEYAGGASSTSCFTCHGVDAPHPKAPWRGGVYTHANADPVHAAICMLCHAKGSNSAVQPASPAPAGSEPGCFNNTLCHAIPGHRPGWSDPARHGVAAKTVPSATAGLSYCKSCHGADFSGGSASASCFTCHGVNAPHAAGPWSGKARSHATTDAGNAPVCAPCHAKGANSSMRPSSPVPAGASPGCFNNTLCHASFGRSTERSDASRHGATAE